MTRDEGRGGLKCEHELLAANRRLRDAYADAVAGLRYVLQQHGRLSGVGFDRVDDRFFELVTMPEREGLLAGSHTLPVSLALPPAPETAETSE